VSAAYDSPETWDRLVLLLIARPRDGWEEVYAEITRREVERLAPPYGQIESPTADPDLVGQEDGNRAKEYSAYGCIILD
jgi:NADPH-dependent 2,4-dienoyl-CoA reductase/sulfur reductase-like enzyme